MHPSRGIRGWLSPTLAVYDDRGRRTPIIGLADLRETLREAGEIDEYAVISRRSGLHISTALQACAGIVTMLVIITIVVDVAATPVAVGVLCPVLFVWIWHDWPARLTRRVRRAMLASQRCPACGFEIDPDAREPDLRVVCRECGSAWLPIE